MKRFTYFLTILCYIGIVIPGCKKQINTTTKTVTDTLQESNLYFISKIGGMKTWEGTESFYRNDTALNNPINLNSSFAISVINNSTIITNDFLDSGNNITFKYSSSNDLNSTILFSTGYSYIPSYITITYNYATDSIFYYEESTDIYKEVRIITLHTP